MKLIGKPVTTRTGLTVGRNRAERLHLAQEIVQHFYFFIGELLFQFTALEGESKWSIGQFPQDRAIAWAAQSLEYLRLQEFAADDLSGANDS